MSNPRTALAALVAVTAITAMIAISCSPVTDQQSAEGPGGEDALGRIAGRPDFSGVWQANNTANWDLQTHNARPIIAQPGLTTASVVLAAPVVGLGALGWVPPGLGVVDGEEIPYLPWAAARKQENLENWMDRDPEIKCFQPGVPRAMYMPQPFQIIQSADKIMMVFEYANAHRTIHLDEMNPYPNISFMGYSVGSWDEDTLVVDVTNFTDATWFDRSGNFHSDTLHVVERYTLVGPDVIGYEATIEDPQVFSRPWIIRMPLYRRLDSNARLMDFRCVEMVEETMYGHLRKEQLVTSWSGQTMDVEVTRTIPPIEEVHERYISGNPRLER